MVSKPTAAKEVCKTRFVEQLAVAGKPQETEVERPFARTNQDGRLKSSQSAAANCSISGNCFRMPDGETYGQPRNPTSDTALKSHVVGRNADGRLRSLRRQR
jgi:hypothetical protein